MKSWPQIAINNSLISYLLFGLCILFFAYTYTLMPQSEDPALDIPIVGVGAFYPGASVVDIESQVADIIESAMDKLNDVIEINTSITDDFSYTEIEFSYGVDPSEKIDEVQAQLNSIKSSLPSGVYELEVFKYSTSNVNVFQLALISKSATYKKFNRVAEDIEKHIKKSRLVSEVNLYASVREELHVSIDPSRLQYYNVTLDQMEKAIQSYGVVIPSGKLRMGDQSIKVKASGTFEDLNDIRQIVIGLDGNRLIRLEELAEVTLGYSNQNWRARYNGENAVYLTVQMKPGGDIFELKDDVERNMRNLDLPKDMELLYVFDQSEGVHQRVNGFMTNLWQGIGLVGLICLIVLGWRSSLLVMMAVPASILIGLGLTYMMGYSINQITIAGLVIALGLLVDDAIAVAENTKRYLKEGLDLKTASIKGASELVVPLLSGTITTIFAFIPIILVPDITGAFIRPMPIVVIWTLLVSSIIAIVIIPLLSIAIPGAHTSALRETRASAMLHRMIHGRYTTLLKWTLDNRWLTLGLTIILLIGSFALFVGIDVSFFPKAEKPIFRLQVETSAGSALEATDEIVKKIEAELLANQEIEFVASNIGHGNPRIYYNMFSRDYSSRFADILVGLKSYDPTEFQLFLEQIRSRYSFVGNATVSIKEFVQGPSPDAPIYIEIEGPELSRLKEMASQVESVMQRNPDILNVYNPLGQAAINLQYKINKDKALASGIPIHFIDKTLRTMINGKAIVEYINDHGDKIPVILRHQSGQEVSIEDLSAVPIESLTGEPVLLSELSTIVFDEGHSSIFHKDNERITYLEADLGAEANLADVVTNLKSELDKQGWNKEYQYRFRGDVEAQAESFGSMGFAALISFILIFGVLVIQFHSFVQPIIIFLALPFAMAGAIVLLYITGVHISFTGFVGFTSLIGIAINNTIVLIEFANREIENGQPVREAIMAASQIRFMPIFLTTLTTVLGLLPLTLFGGTLWQPMGCVIIGGMITSTILVLLVVPLIYSMMTKT